MEGEIKVETKKALLVVLGSRKEVWIRKSTIKSKYMPQIGVAQTFKIDTWVLQKK